MKRMKKVKKQSILRDRLYLNKSDRDEQFFRAGKECQQIRQLLDAPIEGLGFLHSRIRRKYPLSRSPESILDAQNIITDINARVLDWSVNNMLAIALGTCIYCWDQETRQVREFEVFEETDTNEHYINELKWDSSGRYICYADTNNYWSVVDLINLETISSYKVGHQVSAIAWRPNDENGFICLGDVEGTLRGMTFDQIDECSFKVAGHTQAVLQIEWTSNGSKFARLGLDGTICIWKFEQLLQRQKYAYMCMEIKLVQFGVICWNPFNGYELVSGSGSTLIVWDTITGKKLNEQSVGQRGCVTRLVWGYDCNEFITGHQEIGEIVVWHKDKLQVLGTLSGHVGGVLQLVTSVPQRCWLISAGADEALKFWKLGPKVFLNEKGQDTFSSFGILR
eukprot:TRINITY_DN15205_c0_g1_i13.p2 TRINITY_DN15205_c0_g1~~TRINITY_DN15205_c0_g1_i13.p2  ORF type:complete len:430 (+),score=24.73 TRINITY_DN15205_c0_g1_i13:111-1292(+)